MQHTPNSSWYQIRRSSSIYKSYLFLTDLIVYFISPFVALLVLERFAPSMRAVEDILPYALTGLPIAFMVLLIFGAHRSIWRYTSLSDIVRLFIAMTVSLIATLLVFSTAAGFDILPYALIPLQWSFLILATGAIRAAYRMAMGSASRKTSYNSVNLIPKQHVFVLGVNPVSELYLRCVKSLAADKIAVEGILDENTEMKDRYLHHHKVVGQPQDLATILAQYNVHGVSISSVVITVPFENLQQKTQDTLLHWERSGNIKLDMFVEKLGFNDNVHAGSADNLPLLEEIDKHALPAKEMSDLSQPIYQKVRRAIDIVGAAGLLLLLPPVIIVVGLLVAIDVGNPVIFWQARPGRRGWPFRVYKFRTMKAAHDKHGCRIPDEQRQSTIGRTLRRLRLDEIPQLYLILTGKMSFIGPRPLLPCDLPPNSPGLIAERNQLRPGLTGWAQVNGGQDVSIEDKMVLDLWYIRNMSLKLDLEIIAKTVRMIIYGERIDNKAIATAYKDLQIEDFEALNQTHLREVEDLVPAEMQIGR